MNEEECDEKQFYRRFSADLSGARGLVLIQSPFVAVRRIDNLLADLSRAIQRRVRICTFVQEPKDWSTTDAKAHALLKPTKGAIELLESIGVHVSLRKKIHEKLVVIDDNILWDGSLNVLSHSDTSERMTRWVSASKVRGAITKHKLHTCDHCACLPSTPMFPGGNPSADVRIRYLAHVIRARRTELGLSQRALAHQTGIPHTVIADIELGRRNITVKTLMALLVPMGIELAVVPRCLLPTIGNW